jgi:hypothetical protein
MTTDTKWWVVEVDHGAENWQPLGWYVNERFAHQAAESIQQIYQQPVRVRYGEYEDNKDAQEAHPKT